LKLRRCGDWGESWPPCRHRHGGWSFAHKLVDAVAFPLERCKHLAVKLARAREFDRHRVDETAVDDHLVVKVRAGRQPRVPEIADSLSLDDMHALGDPAAKA
jgi:hypothetical protein